MEPVQDYEYEGMLAETVTMAGHNSDLVHAYLSRPLAFGDGKPQTTAAGGSGARLVHPVETLKDVRQVFSRNTFAGVDYAYLYRAICCLAVTFMAPLLVV